MSYHYRVNRPRKHDYCFERGNPRIPMWHNNVLKFVFFDLNHLAAEAKSVISHHSRFVNTPKSAGNSADNPTEPLPIIVGKNSPMMSEEKLR